MVCKTCLLISAPGARFPRTVRGASSALLRLRGLPCPVLQQESSAFRSNQHCGKIIMNFVHIAVPVTFWDSLIFRINGEIHYNPLLLAFLSG
jgi:hypothetical protein